MPRVAEWIRRHQETFRRVAHMVEAVTLMSLMVGGGVGAGYAISQWHALDVMAERRADHQAEIERLQKAYSDVLSVLAPKVHQAADSAAVAAEASVEAAKSVTRAARAPVSQPRQISDAERKQINREIDYANRLIKEANP